MFAKQALKTVSYIALVLMLAIPTYARIVYEYDDAGNRVLRHEIVMQQARRAVDNAEETPEVFEEKLAETKISIFPNPTKGILQVEITNAENLQNAQIRLYNPQGVLVTTLNNLSEMTTLDISAQPDGIYVMQIALDKDNISIWKIIKN